jgi:hypothetical protein
MIIVTGNKRIEVAVILLTAFASRRGPGRMVMKISRS